MNHSPPADPRFDPDRIFRELEAAAEEMANTKADADRLEELRKPLLYEIATNFIAEGMAVAAAERLAYASQEYRKHIEGMVEARRRATRAQARYHDLRVLAGLRQTEEASARALTR